MNGTITPTGPTEPVPRTGATADRAVDEFVAAVRARFSDLDPDERDDVLGGLDADLAEQVAEAGPGSLGDPVAHADELRAAAGLPPFRAATGRFPVARLADLVRGGLDEVGARWARLLDSLPGDLGGALRAAVPAWWVMRAWLATMVVSRLAMPPFQQDVPYLPTGSAGLGATCVAVAAVVSIQCGRGAWWPVLTRNTWLRAGWAGLNACAVMALPFVVDQIKNTYAERAFENTGFVAQESDGEGLQYRGEQVCNLHPYDAQGRPLNGVQLFTSTGKPFAVRCAGEWDVNGDAVGETTAPWKMGDVNRWNVFPLPESATDWETGQTHVLRQPAAPKPTVPAVTSPVMPGVGLSTDAAGTQPSASPSAPTAAAPDPARGAGEKRAGSVEVTPNVQN